MPSSSRGRSWFYGACPTCGANEGVDCKRPSGHGVFPPHVDRPTRWPCPECGLPVLERDECQMVTDLPTRRVFAHNICAHVEEAPAPTMEGQEVLF